MPEDLIDLTTVGIVGASRGYDLRGFLYDGRTNDYVVLLFRPWRNLDPFVVGRVRTLQDDEWSNGRYFRNPRAATMNLVQRAGLEHLASE
jgi:hypothetical protein